MISEMMIKVPTHQSIAGFCDFPFALASDGLVCLVLIRGSTCRIVGGDLPNLVSDADLEYEELQVLIVLPPLI
jgi:hypothetical protein